MRIIATALVAAMLAACASTSVTPLSRNQILISTSAAPACGVAGAQRVASRMAAVETLRAGFERFVIAGAQSQNNVRAIPVAPIGSTTTGQATTYGNTTYGTATTQYYGGGVMYSGSNDANLHVIMLNPGDVGYEDGVDARVTLGPDWARLVEDGIKTC